MITVYQLTETQKDSLVGVYYDDSSTFNPVQDGLGRWIITIEEISQITNPAAMWIFDENNNIILPAIEWIPPTYDDEE